MANIHLIRHGQSEANIDSNFYFKKPDSEIKLSEDGRIESIYLGRQIHPILSQERKYKTKSLFLYSPFIRAAETLTLSLLSLQGYMKFIDIIQSPLLIERQWGDLRKIVKRKKHDSSHFKFFYKPNSGESFFELYQRVLLFNNQMKEYKNYKNIFIYTHGEWIKIFDMIQKNMTVEEFEQKNHNIIVNNAEIFKTYIF